MTAWVVAAVVGVLLLSGIAILVGLAWIDHLLHEQWRERTGRKTDE